MEILWWLAPPVVVTLLAMVWVSWFGREGRGEIGRDEAVRRVGVALDRAPVPPRRARNDDVDDVDDARSRGVVVRRAPVDPPTPPVELLPAQPRTDSAGEGEETVRRAS